ncbi:MAG: acyl-CoA thioesterase [Bacteroides sp.]|nr:acyl-CoA thioesterase [Bacteroides sp.]MBD5307262.1 acyl-CoA thioesterase [Bacteroides sp.]
MKLIKENQKKYCYLLEMEVRDYELDCEQIVNNANYLHYMEHTRHKFCLEAGLSFIEMHEQGIDAVVRKIEIEYHTPLRGCQSFVSALNVERKGARYIFHQDIFRQDGVLVTTAVVTVAIIKDGRVSRGDEIASIFAPYLSR